jgi:hypothetical protein
MVRSAFVIAVIAGIWLSVACGNGGSGGSSQNAAPKAPEGAGAPAQSAQAAGQPQPGQPVTINTLFPPGPGHDLALNTCGTCHPVACVARGQRTPDSWASIKGGHQDKLVNMSTADQDAVFAYLQEHFNNTRPEPKIPADLIQQGCTPF